MKPFNKFVWFNSYEEWFVRSIEDKYIFEYVKGNYIETGLLKRKSNLTYEIDLNGYSIIVFRLEKINQKRWKLITEDWDKLELISKKCKIYLIGKEFRK